MTLRPITWFCMPISASSDTMELPAAKMNTASQARPAPIRTRVLSGMVCAELWLITGILSEKGLARVNLRLIRTLRKPRGHTLRKAVRNIVTKAGLPVTVACDDVRARVIALVKRRGQGKVGPGAVRARAREMPCR